jgi:hypothetical protein
LEEKMPFFRVIKEGLATFSEIESATITHTDILLMNAYLDMLSDVESLANSDIGVKNGN